VRNVHAAEIHDDVRDMGKRLGRYAQAAEELAAAVAVYAVGARLMLRDRLRASRLAGPDGRVW
jgi:hypothetical protein